MDDVPRVELFAQQETPGWDVWGNEAECSPGYDEIYLGYLNYWGDMPMAV